MHASIWPHKNKMASMVDGWGGGGITGIPHNHDSVSAPGLQMEVASYRKIQGSARGPETKHGFSMGVVGIKIPRHVQSGKARLSAVLAHVMAIPVDGIGVPLAHVPAQTSVPNAF